MSLWLITVVTVIYAITAILQIMNNNAGFALMWFAYALANVGIMMAGGAK